MDAVTLHQFFVHRDSFHEKFDPRHLMRAGHVTEYLLEGIPVARSVVRRDANTEYDDGRARGFARADDFLEVGLHPFRRKSSEAIVAAEFQNDQGGIEGSECRFDTGSPSLSCFAADAGVNHTMFVPLSLQTGLQQSGPGLVNVYAVSRAQAVAEDQYSRCLSTVSVAGQQDKKKDNNSSHGQ